MRLFLLSAILLIHSVATASTNRCTPPREGEVACMGGKLCECRYDPGGTLTGRPAGMRWNCGPLRPACGPVPEAGPPPLPAAPSPLFLPGPSTYPEWR